MNNKKFSYVVGEVISGNYTFLLFYITIKNRNNTLKYSDAKNLLYETIRKEGFASIENRNRYYNNSIFTEIPPTIDIKFDYSVFLEDYI